MALAPFPEDWSRALCIVAHPDDLEDGLPSRRDLAAAIRRQPP